MTPEDRLENARKRLQQGYASEKSKRDSRSLQVLTRPIDKRARKGLTVSTAPSRSSVAMRQQQQRRPLSATSASRTVAPPARSSLASSVPVRRMMPASATQPMRRVAPAGRPVSMDNMYEKLGDAFAFILSIELLTIYIDTSGHRKNVIICVNSDYALLLESTGRRKKRPTAAGQLLHAPAAALREASPHRVSRNWTRARPCSTRCILVCAACPVHQEHRSQEAPRRAPLRRRLSEARLRPRTRKPSEK